MRLSWAHVLVLPVFPLLSSLPSPSLSIPPFLPLSSFIVGHLQCDHGGQSSHLGPLDLPSSSKPHGPSDFTTPDGGQTVRSSHLTMLRIDQPRLRQMMSQSTQTHSDSILPDSFGRNKTLAGRYLFKCDYPTTMCPLCQVCVLSSSVRATSFFFPSLFLLQKS